MICRESCIILENDGACVRVASDVYLIALFECSVRKSLSKGNCECCTSSSGTLVRGNKNVFMKGE